MDRLAARIEAQVPHDFEKSAAQQIVKRILRSKCASGPDMDTAAGLMQTILLRTTSARYLNLPDMSGKEWEMSVLTDDGAHATVYTSNLGIDNTRAILKTAKKISDHNTITREYLLGTEVVNPLRTLIPTFVHTLGAFVIKEEPYIIYERIDGPPVANLLKRNRLLFGDWLEIFIQILLSLELAQRQSWFSHFDLHTSNVITRKTGRRYEVPLDNTLYTVDKTAVCPVIIDFGTSCGQVGDKSIGSNEFKKYGMLSYMVPGYDMYKFIVSSARYASEDLQPLILGLFAFYGTDDPYNIVSNPGNIKVASREYCRRVTYSSIASNTPHEFLNWIFERYTKYLPNVKRNERTIFVPINEPPISTYPLDIPAISEACKNVGKSYVMAMYTVYVLDRYNVGLKDSNVAGCISRIVKSIENDHSLVQADRTRLEKYKRIRYSTINRGDLEVLIQAPDDDKHRVAKGFVDTCALLDPYVQFYYTIIELDLLDMFSEWLTSFYDSKYFESCVLERVDRERVRRWIVTLKLSMRSM
jgi:hypothetical protein